MHRLHVVKERQTPGGRYSNHRQAVCECGWESRSFDVIAWTGRDQLNAAKWAHEEANND